MLFFIHFFTVLHGRKTILSSFQEPKGLCLFLELFPLLSFPHACFYPSILLQHTHRPFMFVSCTLTQEVNEHRAQVQSILLQHYECCGHGFGMAFWKISSFVIFELRATLLFSLLPYCIFMLSFLSLCFLPIPLPVPCKHNKIICEINTNCSRVNMSLPTNFLKYSCAYKGSRRADGKVAGKTFE